MLQKISQVIVMACTVTVLSLPVLNCTVENTATAVSIPGKVQAENYLSFNDSTLGNEGAEYRQDNVDIQATSDDGGGYYVGWITAGEYLTYSIRVPQAGEYDFTARVASIHSNRLFQLRVDGVPIGNDLSVPNTAGWQNWQNVTTRAYLEEGDHELEAYFHHDEINLNYIDISAVDPNETPPSVEPPEEEPPGNQTVFRVMSLNVYGYATMPAAASAYADTINAQNIDLLGIQEGVNDWLITGFPTDYSRASALGDALGGCWERFYQIFINTCRDNQLIQGERFDLTDGPNAARTGESVHIVKEGRELGFINIHWDHQDSGARWASARETADAVNAYGALPVVVVGDFNTGCASGEVNDLLSRADLSSIVNGGIDCIVGKGLAGGGSTINAAPSDHPGVVAELK